MNTKKILFILSTALLLNALVQAQPVNDNCANATNITVDTICGYPLSYGAVSHNLSYGNIATTTWPVAKAELELFKAMGVQYYVIHLGYDAWLTGDTSQIAMIDSAVAWIRANGGKVHIADGCAESLRHNRVSWAAFDSLFLLRMSVWTQRYHPDAMTVVKEPGWYNGFLTPAAILSLTPAIWGTLGMELDSLVKAISPATQTIYADATSQLIPGGTNVALHIQILALMVQDPNLDIVGLDIYGSKCGGDSTTPHLQPVVDSVLHLGKKLWTTETWATTSTYMNTDSCPNLSGNEIQWAQQMSDYAVANTIPVVEWFFTVEFTDTLGQPTPTYYGIEDVMHYRLSGSTLGATQSAPPVTCGGSTGTVADDVWYQFVATATSHTLQVKSGPGFDAVVEVRSGACPGTNIACANATGVNGLEVVSLTGLSIGSTYLYRVYNYNNANGGSFRMCLTDYISTGITSVSEALRQLTIIPNPATDEVQVSFDSETNGDMKLQLMDMTGKLILEQSKQVVPGNNITTILMNELANGCYIMKVAQGDYTVAKKLVVAR
jgi:hypothetical protein